MSTPPHQLLPLRDVDLPLRFLSYDCPCVIALFAEAAAGVPAAPSRPLIANVASFPSIWLKTVLLKRGIVLPRCAVLLAR